MKYAFFKTCLDSKLIGRKKLISVRKAAALLRISTSGYYQWLKVDRYHRHGVHHSDAELLCHVRSVISRCGKQVPGVMRLYLALRQQGLSVVLSACADFYEATASSIATIANTLPPQTATTIWHGYRI